MVIATLVGSFGVEFICDAPTWLLIFEMMKTTQGLKRASL